LDKKRYKSFRISKDIGQGTFQIELPEEWMIHNMFNKDLLTQYRKPHFKGQHIDSVPLPEIINKEKEYKIEEIRNYRKQGCCIQFLVH